MRNTWSDIVFLTWLGLRGQLVSTQRAAKGTSWLGTHVAFKFMHASDEQLLHAFVGHASHRCLLTSVSYICS